MHLHQDTWDTCPPGGASHGIGTHLIPLDFCLFSFAVAGTTSASRRPGVAGEEASRGYCVQSCHGQASQTCLDLFLPLPCHITSHLVTDRREKRTRETTVGVGKEKGKAFLEFGQGSGEGHGGPSGCIGNTTKHNTRGVVRARHLLPPLLPPPSRLLHSTSYLNSWYCNEKEAPLPTAALTHHAHASLQLLCFVFFRFRRP